MLGAKYMQGCIFAFIILTILSLLLEGSYLGSEQNNLLNELTSWTVGMASWWTVPIVFGSILWNLPDLISWDYSFFTAMGAGGAIIRLILGATVSFGILWGLLTLLLPVAWQALTSLGRGAIGLLGGFR